MPKYLQTLVFSRGFGTLGRKSDEDDDGDENDEVEE